MRDQIRGSDFLPLAGITFGHASPTPWWVLAVRKFYVGALVGWIGFVVGGVAVLEFSAVRPPPLLPPVLGGIVCALFALMIPMPRPWTAARIGRCLIRVSNEADDAQEIHSEDIQLIAGEAGISLDGGQILVWKRVRITTARGTYVIKLDPKENKACYQHLLLACPEAVGVSYTGEVRIPGFPEGPKRSEHLEWLASVLRAAAREFGRQTRWAAGVAGLMALVTAGFLALITLAATSEKPGQNLNTAASMVVELLVFGAVTLVLAGRAMRIYLRGRRIVQALGCVRDDRALARRESERLTDACR